jgi:hypothetical protein
MNASSAEKCCPGGRLALPGNDQRIRPSLVTMRSRPFPRSAIRSPPGNRPVDMIGTGEPLGSGVSVGGDADGVDSGVATDAGLGSSLATGSVDRSAAAADGREPFPSDPDPDPGPARPARTAVAATAVRQKPATTAAVRRDDDGRWAWSRRIKSRSDSGPVPRHVEAGRAAARSRAASGSVGHSAGGPPTRRDRRAAPGRSVDRSGSGRRRSGHR